ncbi:MAG: tol-pal system YbgF family protein [Pyrinomonadaceae bacterium]
MRRRVSTALLVLQASVVALVLLLAAYVAAHGQQLSQSQPKPEATKTDAPAFDQARFDRLRAEGAEAIMNLDYETAKARFAEMAHEFPDHPGGSQYLAAALWLKTLNSSRRLQSGIYNTDSFYEGDEDKVDPSVVAQFRELTRTARLLAQARLKKNPDDVEMLYFLGATEALKSAFEAAVERRFLGAWRDSGDAVDLHGKVLKLDPNYHDAELSIGMYDYILGDLPWLYRQFARLHGDSGSKKRGITELERVAQQGKWARDDARVLLIPLYKRERRFAEAAANARELAAKYPRNYIFKLEAADALVSQAETVRASDAAQAAKLEQEAFATFESLLSERPPRGASSSKQIDQIHFEYAEALFRAGQMERAAREFVAASEVANAEPSLATMAHLRAAQSLDLAGKRADALTQYKAVLARPDVYKAHDEAERGLREPYRKQSASDAGGDDAAGAGAKSADVKN